MTGKGLAGVLREHYPRALYPAVIALVIANTLNAGLNPFELGMVGNLRKHLGWEMGPIAVPTGDD